MQKFIVDDAFWKIFPDARIAVLSLKDVDETARLSDEEMKEIADNKPGFIRAMWCGDRECEDKLKDYAGVTSRCIPFEQEELDGKCVCCGKEAKHMLYWGKAY